MTTNYREASERAKDERRAPAPDELKIKGRKKKVAKPFVVMYAGLWAGMKPWVRHRCATREQAEQLLAKARRRLGGGHEMWVEEKP